MTRIAILGLGADAVPTNAKVGQRDFSFASAMPAGGWSPDVLETRSMQPTDADALVGRTRTAERCEELEEVVRISPIAYFKSMLALAWACIRHPFETTVIDVTTGKVLERSDGQENRHS
ncbi:MAG: hypothetical protein HYS13_08625 [Planctomycetia bacterium]|nr:hypothetical protein [Planctomycetia bacterium]